jgi:hypothetical protein
MDGFFTNLETGRRIRREKSGYGKKVPDPNPHPDSLPDPVADRDSNLQLLVGPEVSE